MGEWIRKNPILYALINFSLCIIVVSFLLKVYIDYRIDKKMEKIEIQLNVIESSTDTILEIMKEGNVYE